MVIFYSHVSLPERKWAAVDAGEVDEADRYTFTRAIGKHHLPRL